MVILQGLLLALGLMTRIPVSLHSLPNKIDASLKSVSTMFYPFVGLIIGALLCLLFYFLPQQFSSFVQAAIILTAWVMITGALHLDGLADSIDAAFASHKSHERTLEVFRDPNAGPMAVVAIVIVLILKLVFIEVLIARYFNVGFGFICIALIASTILSRLTAVIFMGITPYARQEGMAYEVNLIPYRFVILVLTIVSIICLWFFSGVLTTAAVVCVLVAWLMYWRSFWLTRIDGYTGDCVGALIEVAELLVLFVFLWALPVEILI